VGVIGLVVPPFDGRSLLFAIMAAISYAGASARWSKYLVRRAMCAPRKARSFCLIFFSTCCSLGTALGLLSTV